MTCPGYPDVICETDQCGWYPRFYQHGIQVECDPDLNYSNFYFQITRKKSTQRGMEIEWKWVLRWHRFAKLHSFYHAFLSLIL